MHTPKRQIVVKKTQFFVLVLEAIKKKKRNGEGFNNPLETGIILYQPLLKRHEYIYYIFNDSQCI